METDRLHQLRVLSATESLTETASFLGMTPGALSKSMRVLSEQLGFAVYESVGRGLRLTERAKRVAARSEAILKSLESLRDEGAERAIPLERLRLGSFEVFTGKLARFYFSDFPSGSELECHELIPGEIEEALLRGKIDVGITYQPVPRSDIAYQKVLTLRMGIFGSSKFHGQKLEELPFVTPLAETASGHSRAKGLDGWDDLKFPRNIVHRVNLLETGIQLASVGHAVIFMPAFLARIFNEGMLASVRLQALEHPVPARMGAQDVFLVTRRGEEDSMWARRVAKLLRKCCRD